MGPDVYIGVAQGTVINYAIRGALLPMDVELNADGSIKRDKDGNTTPRADFAEVTADFNDAAMLVLGIDDANGEHHYYGLPETQNFTMMFIRNDIFAELNIEIPQTWDDVKEIIPVLQSNNMQIGMTKDENIFLYQLGGELFADNGMRINLGSNVALEAFNTMCEMFTMYSFPYKYDFPNRFRTGEMPIGFASYTDTYNKLKVFATEIEGLWSFYPLPGYYDENGEINNSSVSTITAICIITDCNNIEGAWEFSKWHAGEKCQIDYSNEMVAILGPSAKHATANTKALQSLPWTAAEYVQLEKQFNKLAAIPNYPGRYIVERYTQFAFLAAYDDNMDPVTEMQRYLTTINVEITRKRIEFGLETLEDGQTLAEKRMFEAEEALKKAHDSSSYKSAYDTAYNNVMKLIEKYETEDYASLRALAAELEALDAGLFGTAVAKLREAANSLVEYEKYK
jgi:ABC-type glycerol-3-phosphate transport system substrate-binding protein